MATIVQELDSDVSVTDFYGGKCVFITGGTGFVGKVIVEKLLYSCPKVKNIYMLIRKRKNHNLHQRLQTFFDNPVFDRLRNIRPEDVNKVIPVSGDISAQKLGLSDEDEYTLLNEISVVIHAAATVRFDEPLRTAYDINLEGTRQILNLCKRMNNIQVLIHVSTAYCNTQNDVIEEKMYRAPVSVEEVGHLVDKYNHDEHNMDKYLYGRPNTYTFTKALSETLVEESHGDIPVIIIRPSIVTASKNEPVEGWVDSWNGATGALSVIGKGLCRVLFAERLFLMDIIPVDYVSNLIIVAAAKCDRSKKVKVLNCSSSYTNPVTTGVLVNTFIKRFVQMQFNDMPFPTCFVSKHKLLTTIVIFFLEILPAYAADLFLYIFGKETKYVEMQRKLANLRNVLYHFTSNSWVIENREALALISTLSPKDRREFPCDPSDICWSEYLENYTKGVKKYLVDIKVNQ